MEVLEAVPLKKLRWSQSRPAGRCEFTVTFESIETGSALTVTRFGFGEGEDADIFSASHRLGWEHGFRDLVLYLETGQLVKRHWDGCTLSSLGISYRETNWGLQVCQVAEKGVGADAGLQRGDRLVRLANVPVYQRSDVWVLNSLHPAGTEIDVEFVRGKDLLHAKGRTIPVADRLLGE